MAQLTIGVPLYNNAQTLPAALDSLLAQTFTDFRIVISDDASTDATAEIAQAYAARDSRITYIRQQRNLGYGGNFTFLLREAGTPFFMWAAGDDRLAPRYIAANIAALNADPSLAGSVSRAEFVDGEERLEPCTGTYPIKGTPEERLALFLAGVGDSDMSRLFAVHRSAALKAALPAHEGLTFDIGLCAVVTLQGGYHEVPEVLMWRDRSPRERYLAHMRRDAPSGLLGYFPGLATTRWLLRERRIPLTRDVALALLALNVEWHLGYTERYSPRYAAITRPLRRLWERHLNWRCRRPLLHRA